MDPQRIYLAFSQAEDAANHLRDQYSQAAQNAGQISIVLETTKNYWLKLAEESGDAPQVQNTLNSGVAMVEQMGQSLSGLSIEPYNTETLRSVSLSASFFGSNTAATSSLFRLNDPAGFKVEAIPLPALSQEPSLAERFAKVDPALGDVCAQIWQTLLGTTADPERSALFMIRQTWDHFFDRYAPDAEVRKSPFWIAKEGEKKDMVTREERINFAVERWVADPTKKALLLAASRQMRDLYAELNRAHERNEINATKARTSINSLYQWLVQWADALGL